MIIQSFSKQINHFIITSVFFIFLFITVLPLHASTLQVGYSEIDITPPIGTGMPGYFHGRKADGVLDPLLIKVAAITQDDTTLIIMMCDLIGLGRDVVNRMRDSINKKTGLLQHQIFIHATHTHTGAVISVVEDDIVEKSATVVQNALDDRKPESKITIGSAEERAVTFIRRYLMKNGSIRTNPGRSNPDIVRPIGDIDPDVNVMTFHQTKTMLVSHGLHCDCVSGTKFSADYPFHITEGIREELGKEWNVVFLNSCSGNINHINVKDKNQRSGYEESRKIGRTLAQAAIRALNSSKEIEVNAIGAKTQDVNSPIRKVPKELYTWAQLEMQKDSENANNRNFNELTPRGVIRLAETKEENRLSEIIVFHIGSVGIVGLPAECFVEISQDIKHHSLMDTTWVIGLTGGDMGYVPHPRGYQQGGYEATYSSAPLSPETPILWSDTAINMLKELHEN